MTLSHDGSSLTRDGPGRRGLPKILTYIMAPNEAMGPDVGRTARTGGKLLDRPEDPARVEPDRVWAEDRRAARLPRRRHRVGGEAEVVVVRRPRERAVVVVVPGHLAQAVVDAHDDVDVLLRHTLEVGIARPAGGPAVAPHRVRVEVADDRKLRDIAEKTLDPAMRARVADDAAMLSARALEGQR